MNPRAAARAVDALRRGWPIAIEGLTLLAVETADAAVEHHVYERCRSWLKPSDHIPILTEFAF